MPVDKLTLRNQVLGENMANARKTHL